MNTNSHVRDALDDLARELFLRLTQELSGAAIDDPQESLCATLRQVEQEWRTSTPAPSGLDRARDDRTTRVEAVLQSLTADERDALFLHLGRGMRCAEIAKQTGISRWAVLNDLVRAYSRLRLQLGDEDLHLIYHS
ncbi:MAG: RNA polymerase sigma factor [Steroidobacteraceae bacterium]